MMLPQILTKRRPGPTTSLSCKYSKYAIVWLVAGRSDFSVRGCSRRSLLCPMSRGLFELRLRASEGIGRVFYCVVSGRQIMLLHVFVKKTEATPIRELEIARKRMKVLLDV